MIAPGQEVWVIMRYRTLSTRKAPDRFTAERRYAIAVGNEWAVLFPEVGAGVERWPRHEVWADRAAAVTEAARREAASAAACVADVPQVVTCDHAWGTDGMHGSEYCKRCFVSREDVARAAAGPGGEG